MILSPDMAYRQPIFLPGMHYLALRTFTSGPHSSFVASELLIFERETYSPYDNCFVYQFVSLEKGEQKSWWLPEGASAAQWKLYFRLVASIDDSLPSKEEG